MKNLIVCLTLVVVVAGVYVQSTSNKEYCDLCNGHTMCTFGKCALRGACRSQKQIDLDQDTIQMILDKHNSLRQKVALAHVSEQPSAANMNELEWSAELATIAQCWANQCVFGHDRCRNTKDFRVGQNAGYAANTVHQEILSPVTINNTIQSWFDEVKDFNPKYVQSFQSSNMGPPIGHYTQVVWATTKYVGCARVFYMDKPFMSTNIFCNYGPTGNILGQPVYATGEPCSLCESDRVPSLKFEGLCVKEQSP